MDVRTHAREGNRYYDMQSMDVIISINSIYIVQLDDGKEWVLLLMLTTMSNNKNMMIGGYTEQRVQLTTYSVAVTSTGAVVAAASVAAAGAVTASEVPSASLVAAATPTGACVR